MVSVSRGYILGTISHVTTGPTALATNSYDNGSGGVGATLTGSNTGKLLVDGINPSVGQTVLVTGETTKSHNGIYVVTQTGDASHYILTRAAWFNTDANAIEAVYGVAEYGAYGSTRWEFKKTGSIVFGTTDIVFSQWTPLTNLYTDSTGNILYQLGWDFDNRNVNGNSCPAFYGHLVLNAPPNDYAVVVEPDISARASGVPQYGMRVNCFTGTSADTIFTVYDHEQFKYLFTVAGDGKVLLNTTAPLNTYDQLAIHMDVNGAGTVTLENTNPGTSNNTLIYFQNDGGTRMGYIGLTGNAYAGTSYSGAKNALILSGAYGGVNLAGTCTWWDVNAVTVGMKLTGGGGLQVGSGPTGGDKGAGTINVASNIYRNGTAYSNPDFVFEKWATGKVSRFAAKDGASRYDGLWRLDDVRDFVREHLSLPRLKQARESAAAAGGELGLFDGNDAVLASLEEAYLYIFELKTEIDALKARLADIEV